MKFFSIFIAILVDSVIVAGQISYYGVPIIDALDEMYSVNRGDIHTYCSGLENDKKPWFKTLNLDDF